MPLDRAGTPVAVTEGAMNGRRWLAFILGLLVVAGGVALYLLPELVRRTAIARIGALTERPAAIDRVEVNVFTGRVGIYGFRLTERDGETAIYVKILHKK